MPPPSSTWRARQSAESAGRWRERPVAGGHVRRRGDATRGTGCTAEVRGVVARGHGSGAARRIQDARDVRPGAARRLRPDPRGAHRRVRTDGRIEADPIAVRVAGPTRTVARDGIARPSVEANAPACHGDNKRRDDNSHVLPVYQGRADDRHQCNARASSTAIDAATPPPRPARATNTANVKRGLPPSSTMPANQPSDGVTPNGPLPVLPPM